MNSNDFYQLAAELNVMDFTKSKPNYADLARKYDMDYRTVKKYHEGYKGKPKNRAKPSRLDQYKELIIEKLSIPRISRKGVYEFDYSLVIAPVVADLCTTPVALSAPPDSYQNNSQS